MLDLPIPETQLREADNAPPRSGNKTTPMYYEDTSLEEQHAPLQFVVSSQPPSLSRGNQELTKIIRVHAMRFSLRERKLAKDPHTPKTDIIKPELHLGTIGKFKLSTWSRKSSKKRAPPPEVVVHSPTADQGQLIELRPKELDPINSLPIELSSDTKRLLYHYHHEFTQNSFAVNPEGSWYSFAVGDAALLHATLSLVSIHFDLSNRQSVSNNVLYHGLEAIRLLNERLQAPNLLPEDTAVGTVAILAICETMNGTAEASAIHMQGLANMVQLRGGLHAFSQNQVLQRVLNWAAFCYASTWNRELIFPALFQPLPLDPALREPELRPTHVPKHSDTLELFQMLRDISNQIERLDDTGPSRNSLSVSIYLAEYHMCSLQTQRLDDSNSSQTPSNTCQLLFEPFRLAAHLYLHLAIRELPIRANMHHGKIHRLKDALEKLFKLSNRDDLLQFLPFVLWIFYMGATAAVASETVNKRYFLAGLSRTTRALKIQSLMEFEDTLRKVLWVSGFCSKHCSALWKLLSEF